MLSSSQERLLRWLCRIYGLMLLAYPSPFRREYSREMAVVFRTRARDVLNEGRWALLPFMLHVSWDWLYTTLRESTNMATSIRALRWFAALPLAMLAADAAQRIVGFVVRTDFHHLWIRADVTFFFMAAAFVSVGVWVVPSRKDSIARIALSVVVSCAALFIAWGAVNMAVTPLSWGVCILLGGVAGYLPRLRHQSSQPLET
jgi:hypothetical protein